LTSQKISHQRVVSFEIVFPAELADFLIWSSIALDFLSVRLLPDSVQIFMQFVQEIVQKLLTILMVVSSELRISLNDPQNT